MYVKLTDAQDFRRSLPKSCLFNNEYSVSVTLVLAVRVETEKGKGSLEVALKTAEVCFDHLLENTTIIH